MRARCVAVAVLILLLVPGAAAASDITITETAVPSQVRAGDTMTVSITVKNTGDSDIPRVNASVNGFDQFESAGITGLATGASETIDVDMVVPRDASGSEELELVARATDDDGDEELDRDVATATVQVAAFHLTLQLQPDQVVVGEPVEISGVASHRNVPLDIAVGNTYEATVTTDNLKHYRLTYTPETSGLKRVTVSTDGVQRIAYLNVAPRMGVTGLQAPDAANTRERFDVCADLFRAESGPVTVTLLVDGETVDTAERVVGGSTEHCFTTGIQQTGDHTVGVRATADGTQDTRTKQVHIVDSRITVNIFPQELTLQTGSSGVIAIDIVNNDAHARTFIINVTGIANISDLPEQQVGLAGEEERTVNLRVTPQRHGEHRGTITVTADGTTFATAPVTIHAADNPPMRDEILRPLQQQTAAVVDWVRRNDATIILLILAIIVGSALYTRMRRDGVLEPRH